jgi:hypothetical protein
MISHGQEQVALAPFERIGGIQAVATDDAEDLATRGLEGGPLQRPKLLR